MPRALVTGSAGFVGRHFTRHLREQGWNVLGIDILTGHDARDFFRSSGELSRQVFDLVLHCAAVVGGRQTIDNDPLAQAVNLELDAAMFQWAAKARPSRVVYFSSSAAYPVRFQDGHLGRGLREDDIKLEFPELPDKLYGWAKLTGEKLARLAQNAGVAVTVVRPFSGYGEDQDASYPFPAFIDRALWREDPFVIWGGGGQVRDFIHIDDIVAAVMTAVDREESGPLNLCSGAPVRLDGLAAQVCSQAGYEPAFEAIRSAPTGVWHRLGDSSRLAKLYRPQVSLEAGIVRALKYRSTKP